MAGLIENQLSSGRTAYGADTSTLDPTLRTVDQNNDTVAGQLHSLLASGSPYLESAKAGARDTANSRGLINSSIAAGAGEAAAINAALPIAQQDANTFGSAARDNQGFQNNASQFNAAAQNTANLNTAQAANQSELSGQQSDQQIEAIGEQGTQSRQTQAEGSQQAGALSAQQAQERQALQAAGATQAGALSAQQAAQQAALTTQTGQIQSQLSAQQAEQATALQAAKAGFDTAMQSLKGEQAQALADTEATYRGLIQASASAASTLAQATQAILAIQADINTTEAQKSSAIATMTTLLRSNLNVIGNIAGVANLDELLDFGEQP